MKGMLEIVGELIITLKSSETSFAMSIIKLK